MTGAAHRHGDRDRDRDSDRHGDVTVTNRDRTRLLRYTMLRRFLAGSSLGTSCT